MSDSRLLRVVARWVSLLMLATILCPRVPAWSAEAPAPAASSTPAPIGAAVVDTANNQIVISAGEREGIVNGTVFRITRSGQEVARVKVFETSFATSNARPLPGSSLAQIRLNDRAEVVEVPAPRVRSSFKFPWGVFVGAGILALVVLGAVRDNDDGQRAESPSGGAADISIR